MKPRKQKICLITGANRGLGLCVARRLAGDGHIVFAATRSVVFSKKKRDTGNREDNNIFPIHLDVTSHQQVTNVVEKIVHEFGRIDILVNNAGVFLDDWRKKPYKGILELPVHLFEKTIETNLTGALRLIWQVLPIMRKNGFGRIVNISSGMGRFDDMDGKAPFYRISKTGLNALTKIVSSEVEGEDVLVNAVCPGWIRTDMGGQLAPRSPEDAVDGVIWACYLPSDGPSGRFFRDRMPLHWCRKG